MKESNLYFFIRTNFSFSIKENILVREIKGCLSMAVRIYNPSWKDDLLSHATIERT